jgi:hypothetical protein
MMMMIAVMRAIDHDTKASYCINTEASLERRKFNRFRFTHSVSVHRGRHLPIPLIDSVLMSCKAFKDKRKIRLTLFKPTAPHSVTQKENAWHCHFTICTIT